MVFIFIGDTEPNFIWNVLSPFSTFTFGIMANVSNWILLFLFYILFREKFKVTKYISFRNIVILILVSHYLSFYIWWLSPIKFLNLIQSDFTTIEILPISIFQLLIFFILLSLTILVKKEN